MPLSSHRHHLLCRLGLVCRLLPVCIAGCAKVQAEADFAAVRDRLIERTGVAGVYDPTAEHLLEAKLDQLLADGLTIDECVQLSLLNNPDFQALFDQIGASRADVVQSQLLTNPSFSLTMIFPEGGGRPKVPMNIGQELSDLWQIPVKKKIAQAQLEQVMLTAAHRGIDLATETRAAVYRLLAAQQALHLAEENEGFIQGFEGIARQRAQDPSAGPADVNRVRAVMLEARLARLTLHRDSRHARAALARLLGLNRTARAWELADELPGLPPPVPAEVELVAFALKERLDAQALAKQVDAADQQYIRQCASVFPRVLIGPAFELKDSRGVPGRNILADTMRTSVAKGKLTAPTIQSKDQREFARRQIIETLAGGTLQLTLPIWDQNQAQIAKAKFVSDQRRQEYAALLNNVAFDVQQAFAAVGTASELLDLYEKDILPQAETNLAAVQKAYDEGKQGLTALIEAKRYLLTQRQAHIVVRRDAALAVAALKRAVGGRLPESGATALKTPDALEPL